MAPVKSVPGLVARPADDDVEIGDEPGIGEVDFPLAGGRIVRAGQRSIVPSRNGPSRSPFV